MEHDRTRGFQESDPRIETWQINSMDHTHDGTPPPTSALLAQFGLGRSMLPAMREDQAITALHHKAWATRVTAIHTLSRQGAKAPLEPLVLALRDEHPLVRAAAIHALSQQGTRAPLTSLLTALHDVEWRVRAAAVLALGRLEGVHVPLAPLLALLRDRDESVRAAALSTLGKRGDDLPIEPLLTALNDPAWTVREAAVQALAHAGKRAPVGALLAARMDEDMSVREAAEMALNTHLHQEAGHRLTRRKNGKSSLLHFILTILSLVALIPITFLMNLITMSNQAASTGVAALLMICAAIVFLNIVVRQK